MIRTILHRRPPWPPGPPSVGSPRRRLAAETGDTLIEVLISALLIVVVVVASLFGINSANRATALDRARSQADALAQQDEDELHSEPVEKISELTKTHAAYLQEVTNGGTHFTIESTATYISTETGKASCTSTIAKAGYIATRSKVMWGPSLEHNVVETGLVSPPPDASVIVQVVGASGEPVPHMSVETSGSAHLIGETSSDGCAILALNPGEYTLNVSRAGYVDQNGYAESDKDPISNGSFYVVAETTVKRSFEFAPAGELAVSYSGATPAEGDTFSAFNSLLTSLRTFGTLGTYSSTVASYSEELKSAKSLFPFKPKYVVYAGTCEADLPSKNGQAAAPVEAQIEGGRTTAVTVPIAAINLHVTQGTSEASPGAAMSGATGTITDTGCGSVHKFTTTASGELARPGFPFGSYSVCVTGTVAGKPRKYTKTVLNNNAGGTSVPIYLGAGSEESGCP
jgi:Tfp pilus assembly protein PilV